MIIQSYNLDLPQEISGSVLLLTTATITTMANSTMVTQSTFFPQTDQVALSQTIFEVGEFAL